MPSTSESAPPAPAPSPGWSFMRRHGLEAAILAAILASGAILRADLRAAATDRAEIRAEIRAEVAAIRSDLQSLAARVADLGERVARIEGAVPFLSPTKSDQSTR